MRAAQQLGMVHPDGDFNGRSQTGFAPPHGSLRDGLRCSANKGYIRRSWQRPNLDIVLKAFVERIVIDPQSHRAIGVIFEYGLLKHTVRAKREVILSAGSLASPQLLMVSGVGPRINWNHLAFRWSSIYPEWVAICRTISPLRVQSTRLTVDKIAICRLLCPK